MRVLFAGPLFPWSTTAARRQAMLDLGHTVDSIDVAPFTDYGHPWLRKLIRHLHIGRGVAEYNRALVALAADVRPDLVWLELPGQVWPQTVRVLKQHSSCVLSHHTEYVYFRRYWYRHYFPAIRLYDAHIVTNAHTIEALRVLGAKRVIKAGFAYDPKLHRPVNLSPSEAERYRSSVVFVGHWEPTTERRIRALRTSGIDVKVYGASWRWASSLDDRDRITRVFGEEYVKTLCGADICLGFLSKWNKNHSAGRTYEIPACGRFFLAERTDDHLSLFREGHEAEFFDDERELLAKCRYYLQHPDERQRIAEAGHRRCTTGGRTYRDDMERILSALAGPTVG